MECSIVCVNQCLCSTQFKTHTSTQPHTIPSQSSNREAEAQEAFITRGHFNLMCTPLFVGLTQSTLQFSICHKADGEFFFHFSRQCALHIKDPANMCNCRMLCEHKWNTLAHRARERERAIYVAIQRTESCRKTEINYEIRESNACFG